MSEKSEAKRDGASLQRNSGRGILEKGDARKGPFVVDYKEYATSFSVSVTNWAKCATDAWKMHGVPAFKLVLGGKNKVRLWVVGDDMFHEMLEAWEEKYGSSS